MPNIKFKFSKTTFNKFIVAWYHHYRIVFSIAFFLVLAGSAAFWYYNLYSYHWTDEEKKAYLDQYFKQTTFKDAKFKDLVQHLDARAVQYRTDPNLTNPGIFQPDQTKR